MQEKPNESRPVSVVADKILRIHPAIDFTDEFVIVSMPFDSGVLDKNGEVIAGTIRPMHWCITSKREFFLLNSHQLTRRGLYSLAHCRVDKNRWSYKNLEKWLETDIIIPHPRAIYRRTKSKYEYYLDHPDPRFYVYITLWTMGTYYHQLFAAYPIVHLCGETRSGKTKTAIIVAALAFNGIMSANITEASMYRIVQDRRATLVLDENEKISRSTLGQEEINLLLAGYQKGATVIRSDKTNDEKFAAVTYEIYSPKLIANIRGINEEALKNRCVPFILTPSQGIKSHSYPTGEEGFWQNIRDDLYISLMSHWEDVRETRNEVYRTDFDLPGSFAQLWHPIFTMAKMVGEDVLDEMVGLAREKTEDRQQEAADEFPRKLLSKIAEMFYSEKYADRQLGDTQFIAVVHIYNRMVEEMNFKSTIVPEWFNPKWIGKKVSSLDVGRARQENIDGYPTRGYWIDRKRLNEMLKRFNIPLPHNVETFGDEISKQLKRSKLYR